MAINSIKRVGECKKTRGTVIGNGLDKTGTCRRRRLKRNSKPIDNQLGCYVESRIQVAMKLTGRLLELSMLVVVDAMRCF